MEARYRDWVEANRRYVHTVSAGRVGYLHIPDMAKEGYAEFHRGFFAEMDALALILDVRWDSGGYVSELLLSKLARRRLGYDISRWGLPKPYPQSCHAVPCSHSSMSERPRTAISLVMW